MEEYIEMGLPTKRTLLTEYPMWNAKRQELLHMPIRIVYGEEFLQLLEKVTAEMKAPNGTASKTSVSKSQLCGKHLQQLSGQHSSHGTLGKDASSLDGESSREAGKDHPQLSRESSMKRTLDDDSSDQEEEDDEGSVQSEDNLHGEAESSDVEQIMTSTPRAKKLPQTDSKKFQKSEKGEKKRKMHLEQIVDRLPKEKKGRKVSQKSTDSQVSVSAVSSVDVGSTMHTTGGEVKGQRKSGLKDNTSEECDVVIMGQTSKLKGKKKRKYQEDKVDDSNKKGQDVKTAEQMDLAAREQDEPVSKKRKRKRRRRKNKNRKRDEEDKYETHEEREDDVVEVVLVEEGVDPLREQREDMTMTKDKKKKTKTHKQDGDKNMTQVGRLDDDVCEVVPVEEGTEHLGEQREALTMKKDKKNKSRNKSQEHTIDELDRVVAETSTQGKKMVKHKEERHSTPKVNTASKSTGRHARTMNITRPTRKCTVRLSRSPVNSWMRSPIEEGEAVQKTEQASTQQNKEKHSKTALSSKISSKTKSHRHDCAENIDSHGKKGRRSVIKGENAVAMQQDEQKGSMQGEGNPDLGKEERVLLHDSFGSMKTNMIVDVDCEMEEGLLINDSTESTNTIKITDTELEMESKVLRQDSIESNKTNNIADPYLRLEEAVVGQDCTETKKTDKIGESTLGMRPESIDSKNTNKIADLDLGKEVSSLQDDSTESKKIAGTDLGMEESAVRQDSKENNMNKIADLDFEMEEKALLLDSTESKKTIEVTGPEYRMEERPMQHDSPESRNTNTITYTDFGMEGTALQHGTAELKKSSEITDADYGKEERALQSDSTASKKTNNSTDFDLGMEDMVLLDSSKSEKTPVNGRTDIDLGTEESVLRPNSRKLMNKIADPDLVKGRRSLEHETTESKKTNKVASPDLGIEERVLRHDSRENNTNKMADLDLGKEERALQLDSTESKKIVKITGPDYELEERPLQLDSPESKNTNQITDADLGLEDRGLQHDTAELKKACVIADGDLVREERVLQSESTASKTNNSTDFESTNKITDADLGIEGRPIQHGTAENNKASENADADFGKVESVLQSDSPESKKTSNSSDFHLGMGEMVLHDSTKSEETIVNKRTDDDLGTEERMLRCDSPESKMSTDLDIGTEGSALQHVSTESKKTSKVSEEKQEIVENIPNPLSVGTLSTSLEMNFDPQEPDLNLLDLPSDGSDEGWRASDDGSSSSLFEEDEVHKNLDILNMDSSSSNEENVEQLTPGVKKDVFLVKQYNLKNTESNVSLFCDEVMPAHDSLSEEKDCDNALCGVEEITKAGHVTEGTSVDDDSKYQQKDVASMISDHSDLSSPPGQKGGSGLTPRRLFSDDETTNESPIMPVDKNSISSKNEMEQKDKSSSSNENVTMATTDGSSIVNKDGGEKCDEQNKSDDSNVDVKDEFELKVGASPSRKLMDEGSNIGRNDDSQDSGIGKMDMLSGKDTEGLHGNTNLSRDDFEEADDNTCGTINTRTDNQESCLVKVVENMISQLQDTSSHEGEMKGSEESKSQHLDADLLLNQDDRRSTSEPNSDESSQSSTKSQMQKKIPTLLRKKIPPSLTGYVRRRHAKRKKKTEDVKGSKNGSQDWKEKQQSGEETINPVIHKSKENELKSTVTEIKSKTGSTMQNEERSLDEGGEEKQASARSQSEDAVRHIVVETKSKLENVLLHKDETKQDSSDSGQEGNTQLSWPPPHRLTARKHFPPKDGKKLTQHHSAKQPEAARHISLSTQREVEELPRLREESLRPKPAKVERYQAGHTTKRTSHLPKKTYEETPKKSSFFPETPKKAVIYQEPLKKTSSVVPAKSDHRKHRDVAQPSPLKPVTCDGAGAGTSGVKEYELDMTEKLQTPKTQKPPQVPQSTGKMKRQFGPPIPEGKYTRGTLVWGKMKGFTWWPAQIIHQHECSRREVPPPDSRWVKWFGDGKFSLLRGENLAPFQDLIHFNMNHYKRVALYKKAVFQITMIAANRCKKIPDPPVPEGVLSGENPKSSTEKQAYTAACEGLLEWVKQGFQPSGPDGLTPGPDYDVIPAAPRPRSPTPPRPVASSSPSKSPNKSSHVYEDKREQRIDDLRSGKLLIKDMCIGCGELRIVANHPLFVGGLCEVCKIEFLEVAYLFDTDGYQSYCCICAEGKEIVLCGQTGCGRSFCLDCVDILVGPGVSKKIVHEDPWCCFMCSPESTHNILTRREDWNQQLLQFFQDDKVDDFPPLQTFAALTLSKRKPIRVLSLYDGIGTAMLALKELGFEVECYYASEINKDAITVASIRHEGAIQHIGDVREIEPNKLDSLGQLDLLIGGSPCNDLSIVNPARKGIYSSEGTGVLFFNFYRVLKELQVLKLCHDDRQPFFWLFENVVFMGHRDKVTISKFLQCNPVIIDAKDLTPAHRARYFWGNLPGMSRPSIAAAENSLELQDVLERNCNRQAQFAKVRTITTRSNSIKQKEQFLPVIMDGQEDTLWCTEMERIFGFPEHYTDVANLNRTKRHQLLGQAWSVPVIKHLLAPLKDYFTCITQGSTGHETSKPSS